MLCLTVPFSQRFWLLGIDIWYQLILEYVIESLIWIASNGTWRVIQYVLSSPPAVPMLRGTREMLKQYPVYSRNRTEVGCKSSSRLVMQTQRSTDQSHSKWNLLILLGMSRMRFKSQLCKSADIFW